MTINWKKFTAEKKEINLLIKNCSLLITTPPCPSYGRRFQPSKENI
jgi:hypothetical protein